MAILKKVGNHPVVSYAVFWVLVFLFSTSVFSWYFSSTAELLETYAIRVGLQFFTATVIVFVLVPQLLEKKRTKLFLILTLLFLIGIFALCQATRLYHLEVRYPATYVSYLKRFSDPQSYVSRLMHWKELVNTSLAILYPTFLLMAIKYYKDQQQLLKLSEQKRTAELLALKNQLNPHFLFNTLNNMYSLAVKKSDLAPLAIQRLSDILDHILYRCNEQYVGLHREVELIHNYLDLEKIRYGDRVTVDFQNEVKGEVKVAPLVLLTFIENAFKHGVSQELNRASIQIKLKEEDEAISFYCENTKPKPTGANREGKNQPIGLENVRKQLELVYAKTYELIAREDQLSFSVKLKLPLV